MSPLIMVGLLTIAALSPSRADVKHVLDGSAHPPQYQDNHHHHSSSNNYATLQATANFLRSPNAADNAFAVNGLASNVVPGSVAFWWADSNSPFKHAYEYFKKCSSKGNCLPPVTAGFQAPPPPPSGCGSNGCSPSATVDLKNPDSQPGFGPVDIKKNPFLNGQIQSIGSGCVTCNQASNQGHSGGSAYPAVDISKNPFLSGNAQNAGNQAAISGAGQAIVTGSDGFLGVQPAVPFGNQGQSFGGNANGEQGAGQNYQPFPASLPAQGGSSGNNPTKDNKFEVCNQHGQVCVPTELCVNGLVSKHGIGLIDNRHLVNHCEIGKEACCLLLQNSGIGGSSYSSQSSESLSSSSLSTNLFDSGSLQSGYSNLSHITAGKSSVPGSTIKFSGAAGLSPGLIQILPAEEPIPNPLVYNAGESGSGAVLSGAASTIKVVRNTPNPNSVFSSTVDYSNDKLDHFSYRSTTQGPQYLPPISSPRPPISHTPDLQPPFSTYQPSIPTTPKPYVTKPIIPGVSIVSQIPFVPSSPRPFEPAPTQKPYQPTYTQKPYQPTYTQKPYQPTYTQKPYQPTYTQPPYQPSTPKPYQPTYTQKPYQPTYTQKPYQPTYTQPPYQPSTPKPYQPTYTQKPYQPTYTQKPYQPTYTQKPYQPTYTQKPYQPTYTQKPYQPSPSIPSYTEKPYEPQPSIPIYTQKPYQPTYKPYQPSTPKPTNPFNCNQYLPPNSINGQNPCGPPQTPATYPPIYTTKRPIYSTSSNVNNEYVTPQKPYIPPSVNLPQPTQPKPYYTTPKPYVPPVQPTPGYQYPQPSPPFNYPKPTTTSRPLIPEYSNTNSQYVPPSKPTPAPIYTSSQYVPPSASTPGYQYPKPTPSFEYTRPNYPTTQRPPLVPSQSVNVNNHYVTPKPSTNGYSYPTPSPPFSYPTPPKPPKVTPKPYNPQPQPSNGYTYHTPTPGFPTPHPNTPNQYLPPTKRPFQPNLETGESGDGGSYIQPPPTERPPYIPPITGSPNEPIGNIVPVPHAGCAAALKCVQEIYCTADGFISPTPVVLTPQQELLRVPTTTCSDQEAGIVGKCCRDPNYIDPWPSANLLNGVDNGQYREDPNLGQYFPQKQRPIRSGLSASADNSVPDNTAGGSAPQQALVPVTNEKTCGVRHFNSQPKGPGPIDVNFGEIPWQAMVLRDTNRSLLCGGVIVKQHAVLTAAHCVEGLETRDVLIKGGEWKLGIDEEPLPFQIVKVVAIIKHPGYQPGSLQNDLALLMLEDKLRVAKNVAPICLPQPNEALPTQCITTGWGKKILQVHLRGAIMRSVDVNILDSNTCSSKISSSYQNVLPHLAPNTICGYSNNDHCDVDYGSALACTNGNGQYTLAGIYSWDTGCRDQEQIGGYVPADVDWIESVCSKPLTQLKALDKQNRRKQ